MIDDDNLTGDQPDLSPEDEEIFKALDMARDELARKILAEMPPTSPEVIPGENEAEQAAFASACAKVQEKLSPEHIRGFMGSLGVAGAEVKPEQLAKFKAAVESFEFLEPAEKAVILKVVQAATQ